MVNYAGVSEGQSNVMEHNFSRTFVEQTVTECLAAGVNESTDTKFRLRLASGDDVNTIVRLVQGLAVYEKEPDAVNLTAEHYLLDGGSEEPLFYCLMLDYVDGDKPVYTCGMSFLYFGYILGEGRFLYLEDLFLEEAYRKRGGGSLAMKSLARLSTALGCTQFLWVALDWNTPALNLYKKIGAKVQEGVFTTRYGGEALKSFASE
jgi:GNAT superfamily N-acetyltransferase